ncbi:NAD(P)-binding protein [Aulographum hederae CBS 113979]|uniref:NAD(P)-binding protein n=1 Tax=Aulographum hederae CBS 113979 TaxID=1176131 RepID=A0A6G1HEI9_9PEZI|nr:NAD(P)-binding protein [Aulographum hederae CBS 113979]
MAPNRPWALVSPASRGIGLALARRVLRTTRCPVVATARKELDETRGKILEGLDGEERESFAKRLQVLELDVTDESTISTTSTHCTKAFPTSTHHLRLAFVVPGILHPEKSPAKISADDALSTFRINTLGPLLMMKHFSPFLPTKQRFKESWDSPDSNSEMEGLPGQQAVWATMSARVGSISDNSLGGWYSYRASKAAVNQLTKTFDNYLRATACERAMALALHPGTVKTGLSEEFWGSVKEDKLFEADWVAQRLVALCGGMNVEGLGEIGEEGRGRCWDWKGEEVMP